MTTKTKSKKQTIYLLIAIATLFVAAFLLKNQKKSTESNDFHLVIGSTEDGIKLKSSEGSAWKELTFNLEVGDSQAINEYGMTDLDEKSEPSESSESTKLTHYLFVITKTETGINLNGIEGVSFKNLSLSASGEIKLTINNSNIKIDSW